MSLDALIALALGVVMLAGFVALVLLWAFTEEIPHSRRIPYYERLEPGAWGVRLQRPGRRKMRAIRLVNEVTGGDISAAKRIVDHAPAVVVEGVSERVARDLLADLSATGAEAVLFQNEEGEGTRDGGHPPTVPG